jgi:hypothetical protein
MDRAGDPVGHVFARPFRSRRQHIGSSAGIRPTRRRGPPAPLHEHGYVPHQISFIARPRRHWLAHRPSFAFDTPDFLSWRANVHSRGRMLLMLFIGLSLPHHGVGARFMAQPPLLPRGTMDRERDARDCSPMELAIRQALES